MTTSNPWKTLSSKVVYTNHWIRVREDQVIRPDGEQGIYGVVECRKATGVVALTETNEVYLVGQYRYTMEEYSWEIIQGGGEDDESALAAAQRELTEEAGLVAEEWLSLGEEIHLSNCHSSERGYLFLARSLTTTASNPDGTEVLQLTTVPIDEAVAMAERGEIKDAMSIIGLLRVQKFLADESHQASKSHGTAK